MNDRILVAYATRAGSTAEVAEAIAKALRANGAAVDVCPVKQVHHLSPYRAVVLGSAIRMGRWLPEALAFLKAHRAELSRLPVAYFVTCLTLTSNTVENRATVDAYLDPVRAILRPVSVGLFAGALDLNKLSFLNRLMLKAAKTPEGDFRKWDEIHLWGESLQAILN
jgi:menaquinone-dependent protoporphyrinogen oxidase